MRKSSLPPLWNPWLQKRVKEGVESKHSRSILALFFFPVLKQFTKAISAFTFEGIVKSSVSHFFHLIYSWQANIFQQYFVKQKMSSCFVSFVHVALSGISFCFENMVCVLLSVQDRFKYIYQTFSKVSVRLRARIVDLNSLVGEARDAS